MAAITGPACPPLPSMEPAMTSGRLASHSALAAASSRAAGTPVIPATLSGVYPAHSCAKFCSPAANPAFPALISRLASPRRSVMSVPGFMGSQRSAPAAVLFWMGLA